MIEEMKEQNIELRTQLTKVNKRLSEQNAA